MRNVDQSVGQLGHAIDVFVSSQRDIAAARRFIAMTLGAHRTPVEVVTGRWAPLANLIKDLILRAFHNTERYENKRRPADHSSLKARLRP